MSNKKIKITDKTYDPISYLVKGTINTVLGTKLPIRRTYTYEDANGNVKKEQSHSFTEFKKKKNL